MPSPIRMPPLGQTSDQLRLLKWLKSEGDTVAEGEPLFEVETDKATLEVEAAMSGTLLRIDCNPDQTVSEGAVVAWVGEPGEQVPASEAQPPASPAPDFAHDSDGAGAARSEVLVKRTLATPAARTLAREHGIDIHELSAAVPAAESSGKTSRGL